MKRARAIVMLQQRFDEDGDRVIQEIGREIRDLESPAVERRGANLGDRHALFETVHGSAPDIKGKNIANPTAMIQAAVMLLQHLSEKKAAHRIFRALERVLMRGEVLTSDLGGKASTKAFAEAIIREIEK